MSKVYSEEERVDCIKKIAKGFGAKFQTGLEEYTNLFNLTEIATRSELDESNAVIGNIEGYDYCILEFFRIVYGKQPRSFYVSKAIINIKKDNNISFSLLTRKSVILQIINKLLSAFVFSAIYLIVVLGVNHQNLNNQNSIYLIAFLCLILIVALWNTIKTIYKISLQNKYNIQNRHFINNYVILSDTEPKIIGEIFNDEVCSRIVDNKLDSDIIVKNNCITSDFSYDEELTLEGCQKRLTYLLNQAKLFK